MPTLFNDFEICAECGRYLGKNDVYICDDCFKYYLLMKKMRLRENDGLSINIKI